MQGIWGAMNAHVFEEKRVPAFQVSSIMLHCLVTSKTVLPRQVGALHIDKSNAWSLFDGGCQGPEALCGGGGLIFFRHSSIQIQANVGSVTNN